jgi:hypothetical protein
MRIGLIAAFLIYMTSGLNPQLPAASGDLRLVDEGFFETLEKMIPVNYVQPSRDRFVIESASLHAEDRSLHVSVSTEHEKGTLLTLTGLPESTMLDTFQITAEHAASFVLPLAPGQALPCQVVVKSAFDSQTVSVANAPAACQSVLQVSGTLSVGPELAMANGWVTVTLDDVVFATIADKHGDYSLEVYAQFTDAVLTINAAGKVDNKETVVHIYSGSFDKLLERSDLNVSVWSVEILGRRHARPMFAALDLPAAAQ